MTDGLKTFALPDLGAPRCETAGCVGLATHVYGPTCEVELMYLCKKHTAQIERWILEHRNEPVSCKTHGVIGNAFNSLTLEKLR